MVVISKLLLKNTIVAILKNLFIFRIKVAINNYKNGNLMDTRIRNK
jgi:hypothetical protein